MRWLKVGGGLRSPMDVLPEMSGQQSVAASRGEGERDLSLTANGPFAVQARPSPLGGV